MKNIFIPTHSPDDWRHLLADPITQWRSGFSAMSAALSWEAAGGLPPEVAHILGPDATLLLAIPEHKVPLPGGGRPSQCDVFALVRVGADTIAVAIEAKVRETFGPTLAEWLIDASTGKHARLDAICAMLGRPRPPESMRYQLLHRTAAAIVEADRFKTDRAAMVVQSFAIDHLWHEDFVAFCDWLGVRTPRGQGVDLKLPDGRVLRLGWAHSALPS